MPLGGWAGVKTVSLGKKKKAIYPLPMIISFHSISGDCLSCCLLSLPDVLPSQPSLYQLELQMHGVGILTSALALGL